MKYHDPEGKCIVTGRIGIDFHHIITRKAGGPDLPWNMISVCNEIHREFHQKGTDHMVKKYPAIRKWMIENGWEFDAVSLKWRNLKFFALNR